MDVDIKNQTDYQKLKDDYQEYYQVQSHHIDHYVQHVLLLIEFIREAGYSISNKKEINQSKKSKKDTILSIQMKYMDILKGQLSTDELFLLFIHFYFNLHDIFPASLLLVKEVAFFDKLSGLHIPPSMISEFYKAINS